LAKQTSIELFNKVQEELTSGKRKPVYYLCGDEEFFLDRLQDTVEQLVPAENQDFNFDLLYGRDVTPEKVLAIIRSFPMMADLRVVILKDFHHLNRSVPGQEGDGGTVNDLISYFKQPNPSTLFVIIDSRKPDLRTNVGKAIKQGDQIGLYEFQEVPDYRLPDWIIEWIQKEYDKQIDPAAAQLLGQFVGNNLQVLSTEIDKVCTFVDSSDKIEERDVKKIIGLYREYSVIELKDSLLERDLDQSLYIAEQMLQHSKADTGEIIRTVGFFFSVFSNIWQIRRLIEKDNTKKQVQEELGIKNTWYFNQLWKDASTYRLHEMPRVFEALLDTDRAAKGFTSLDPATILLLMIKRIIN